jgi:hypothetical protein
MLGGGGASWVLLGGPVGSQAAGVGGCLQGAVSMACECQLGGSAGQVFVVVRWAGWGCFVHGLGCHMA